MKNILNFLIEVNKLKEMPRTGWVLMNVKNPETVAEHTFRAAVLSWFLARKEKLDVKKAILTALFHDLCEVYGGDITTLLYHPELLREKDAEKRKKIEMRWSRLPRTEKEKIGEKKFKIEKEALSKLIRSLRPNLKKEVLSRWLDYEKSGSREGKLVKEINSVETLIQSVEYFGPKERSGGTTWWEWTEEIVDTPLLLDFLKVIQKKLYGPKYEKFFKQIFGRVFQRDEKGKGLEDILDFLLKLGKLKGLSRLYWLLREVEAPETVAGHIFTLTIMAWIFGRETNLNMEKLLKMALCHEISAVYTGDSTPYDRVLPKDRKAKKEILKKMVRLSKEKKEEIFFKDYQQEKKTIEKLTSKLCPHLRNEIISLWKEYRTRSSPEGRFLSQLNVSAVLLQTLLYEQKDKEFLSAPMWEWAFENVDHPQILSLLKEMKNRFYGR